MNKALAEDKLKVGISIGDINGVGPEIILKTFSESLLLDLVTPVIYGSSRVLSFYKKSVGIEEFNFNSVKNADEAVAKKVNVVNCWQDDVKVEPGLSSENGAKYAVIALQAATDDLMAGKIHCLVTAPIDKSHLETQQFQFPGHTEYLGQRANSEPLMIMVHDHLRVALVTGHIALKDIPAQLTTQKIFRKLQLFHQSLVTDFSIRRPRIAVLSLNPHAGDGGRFGNEEETVIGPAIRQAFQKNMLVMGPYPADGFFASESYRNYDGVLAMYHDQGLIAFKTISAIHGVNFTAGLPFIRTSPDHGSAFDIAGKNLANESAFREAVYMACDLYMTRKNNKEYARNPLRRLSQDLEQREDEDIKAD